MIGIEHTFKVHADANGVVVFDSFVRKEFSHDETRTATHTAVTPDDLDLKSFIVQISYPEGKEPELGNQTVSALFHDALDAIAISIDAGAARGVAPKPVPTRVEKAVAEVVAVVEAKAKKAEAKDKNVVEAIKAEVKDVVAAVEEKEIVAEVKEAVKEVVEEVKEEIAEVKAKL